MRHALRGFIIGLFAVALVINGAASRIMADGQTANAHHIAAKMAEAGHQMLHDHQKQHKGHHHAQSGDATAALGKAPVHDHAGGDTKCCTLCITFDNVVHAFTANASLFRHRIVDFKIDRQLLIGHLVALDPDIPKTIV